MKRDSIKMFIKRCHRFVVSRCWGHDGHHLHPDGYITDGSLMLRLHDKEITAVKDDICSCGCNPLTTAMSTILKDAKEKAGYDVEMRPDGDVMECLIEACYTLRYPMNGIFYQIPRPTHEMIMKYWGADTRYYGVLKRGTLKQENEDLEYFYISKVVYIKDHWVVAVIQTNKPSTKKEEQ